MNRFCKSTILFIFGFSYPLSAQLSYNLDFETGYYHTKNSFEQSFGRWGSRADGKLKYNYKAGSRIAVLDLRARPEFLGPDYGLYSLKLRAVGKYIQYEQDFNWGLNVMAQNFNFDISNSSYTNNSILFNGEISGIVIEDTPMSLRAGYSTRSISTGSKLTLDLLFADVLFYSEISSLQIGYGIYGERFNSDNSISTFNRQTLTANNGFRAGPQIALNYQDGLILNAKYELLLHNSDITTGTSYEHQVNIVAGKLLSSRFSLFIFLNYYLSKLKYNDDYDESLLLYIPANIDNLAFVKFAFDVKENIELYLKSGYRNIELFNSGSELNGWNILFGIEISK